MTELSIILFALVVLMAVLIIVRVNYIERKIKEKKPVNGTTFFIKCAVKPLPSGMGI